MTTTTVPQDTRPDAPPAPEAAHGNRRIAVWDLPTRVGHWLLAASFAGAFVTAESERWRDLHAMLGYTVIGLVAWRLVWGLVGSRHARFSAFAAGPARIASYLKSLFAGRPEHHVGHNPAGGLAIFLLLALGIAVGGSGHATFNEIGGDPVESLHEVLANGMLALVAVHILGVIVSSLMHRENLIGAMITGDKSGPPEAAIGSRHRWLGATLLVAVLAFWGAWNLGGLGNPLAGGEPPAATAAGERGAAGEHRRRHDDD